MNLAPENAVPSTEILDGDKLKRFQEFCEKTIPKVMSGKRIGTLQADEGPTAKPEAKPDYAQYLVQASNEGMAVDLERAFRRLTDYINLFFDPSTMKSIDHSGSDELLRLAILCAACPETLSTVQVRIGMGIHDGDVHSLRVPAYIQGATSLMERALKIYGKEGRPVTEEILPEVVVYSAANMVIQVNQLQASKSLENQAKYETVLRNYVEHCFPSQPIVQARFQFRRDKPVMDVEVKRELESITRQTLEEHREKPVVQKILRTAERHGSKPEDGVLYAVSHAVYSQDPIRSLPRGSMIQGEGEPPRYVLMMGGKSEVEYWKVRQLVRDPRRPGTFDGRAQVITFCEIPPYSGAMLEEDITTAHLARAETESDLNAVIDGLRGSFKRDILAIAPDSNGRLDLFRKLYT